MKNKLDNKEQIWAALFLVTPVIILSKLSDQFADSSLNRILFSGLFGGLGGLLGAGLLQLVKTKTTFIKTTSIIFLTGLCVTTLIVATKLNKPTLMTCEMCGYVAVSSDKRECGYCGTLTWNHQQKINGYDDKQEWLKEEQLFWFALDSLTQPFDFYEPNMHEGFYKDKNWKPIINLQDLIDQYNDEQ